MSSPTFKRLRDTHESVMSYEAIGAALVPPVTKEQVRRIELSALRKLHKSAMAGLVMQYVRGDL